MSKSIIDELYDYDLFHLTEIEDMDGAYKSAMDRLRRLVNEGKIIEYLDNLELKVDKAITRQVERWKKSDSCYQATVPSGDTEKMLGLENCFIGMAREIVFECMIYI